MDFWEGGWKKASVVSTVMVGCALCVILTTPAPQYVVEIEFQTGAAEVAEAAAALPSRPPAVQAGKPLVDARPAPATPSMESVAPPVTQATPHAPAATFLGALAPPDTQELPAQPAPEPPPPEALVAPAPASPPEEAAPGFCFTVDKKEGTVLGVDLDVTWGDGMVVQMIRPGLVEEWNRQNPKWLVENSDRIMEVNGVAGDAEKLLAEIRKTQMMKICVLKRDKSEANETSWSTAEAEKQLFETGRVSFVHIPKTAGTSIEAAILNQPLDVGRVTWGECQWHAPPRIHVRGSFAVIRPVESRVVSEFCWARLQETFKVYKEEFGATEVWPYTCEMFNDWLLAALRKYKQDPSFPWCHMVPQWCYASQVDQLLIQNEYLQTQLQSLHPALVQATIGNSFAESTPKDAGPCKRFNITPACINASNRALLREHFADDYRYIDPLIQMHGGNNAKVGFLTPGRWVIGKVHHDVECMEFTRTLTSASPCSLKPDAPEAQRPTCVSSMLECAHLASNDSGCSSTISYHGTADGGPGGDFPGWCKCVRRGKDAGDGKCVGRVTPGATTFYLARDVARGARCPSVMG